jgi:hypothetical protein
MHYLPFFGNDIYSVKVPVPFGNSPEESQGGGNISNSTNAVKDITHLRFFDRNSFQVTPITSHPKVIEELKQAYYRDPIIIDVLDNYQEAKFSDDKYTVVNALSKVTELQTSDAEFENFQQYIKSNSSKDYLDEKACLKKTLKDERTHSVRSKPFKDWFS